MLVYMQQYCQQSNILKDQKLSFILKKIHAQEDLNYRRPLLPEEAFIMNIIVQVWDSHIKIVRQSSCSFQSWRKNLSSPVDREAWCAAVHGGSKESDMTWTLNTTNQQRSQALCTGTFLEWIQSTKGYCDLLDR